MIRRFLLCAPALVLAACSQQNQPAPVPIMPAPQRPPPSDVPIPPSPPRGEPSDFLNLPQANLRAMLGAPQFMRQDGATEMWRYDGTQCRAFFFLYGAAGSETVRHVETLPAGAASAADPLCLSALRDAKKSSQSATAFRPAALSSFP